MKRSESRIYLAVIIAASLLLAAGRAPAEPLPFTPRAASDAIVLENQACRYEIGLDGKNRAFVNLADGKNHAQPGTPFMLAGRGHESWASAKIALTGDTLDVSFSGCDTRGESKNRDPATVLHSHRERRIGHTARLASVL